MSLRFHKKPWMKRLVALIVLFSFTATSAVPAFAQSILPPPGVRVSVSPIFEPTLLRGIKIDPSNPFKFDFIVDAGDERWAQGSQATPQSAEFKTESTKLIKYFLASLTTPEDDMWVNLSPYEKDRIIPESFGTTEMGRDLLAQDYLLKQISASMLYPEEDLGRRFWDRVRAEAQVKFGTSEVPVSTFNKVWVVPDKAVVYEHEHTAFVTKTHLKVMLEEDYVALSHQKDNAESPAPSGDVALSHPKDDGRGTMDGEAKGRGVLPYAPTQSENAANALGTQILREIVIPELEREVNEGKNFAQLRQVYNSLILATWYKKKLKDSILAKVYVDRKKTAGIEIKKEEGSGKREEQSSVGPASSDDVGASGAPSSVVTPEEIYQQYLEAFKKGVYNYIKEDYDPATQETIPRKYVSGGIPLMHVDRAMLVNQNENELREAARQWSGLVSEGVILNGIGDDALARKLNEQLSMKAPPSSSDAAMPPRDREFADFLPREMRARGIIRSSDRAMLAQSGDSNQAHVFASDEDFIRSYSFIPYHVDLEMPVALQAIRYLLDVRRRQHGPLVVWQNLSLGEMYPFFTDSLKRALGVIEIDSEQTLIQWSQDKRNIPADVSAANFILVKLKKPSSFSHLNRPLSNGRLPEDVLNDVVGALNGQVVMIDSSKRDLSRAQQEVKGKYPGWLMFNPTVETPGHAISSFDVQDFFLRSGQGEKIAVEINGQRQSAAAAARDIFGKAIVETLKENPQPEFKDVAGKLKDQAMLSGANNPQRIVLTDQELKVHRRQLFKKWIEALPMPSEENLQQEGSDTIKSIIHGVNIYPNKAEDLQNVVLSDDEIDRYLARIDNQETIARAVSDDLIKESLAVLKNDYFERTLGMPPLTAKGQQTPLSDLNRIVAAQINTDRARFNAVTAYLNDYLRYSQQLLTIHTFAQRAAAHRTATPEAKGLYSEKEYVFINAETQIEVTLSQDEDGSIELTGDFHHDSEAEETAFHDFEAAVGMYNLMNSLQHNRPAWRRSFSPKDIICMKIITGLLTSRIPSVEAARVQWGQFNQTADEKLTDPQLQKVIADFYHALLDQPYAYLIPVLFKNVIPSDTFNDFRQAYLKMKAFQQAGILRELSLRAPGEASDAAMLAAQESAGTAFVEMVTRLASNREAFKSMTLDGQAIEVEVLKSPPANFEEARSNMLLRRVGGIIFYAERISSMIEEVKSKYPAITFVPLTNVDYRDRFWPPESTHGAVAAIESVQDRIRQSRRFIDWGAGDGKLGLEAAALGATDILFIEMNTSLHPQIRANAERMGIHYKIITRWEDQSPDEIEAWKGSVVASNTGYSFGNDPWPVLNVIRPSVLIVSGGLSGGVSSSMPIEELPWSKRVVVPETVGEIYVQEDDFKGVVDQPKDLYAALRAKGVAGGRSKHDYTEYAWMIAPAFLDLTNPQQLDLRGTAFAGQESKIFTALQNAARRSLAERQSVSHITFIAEAPDLNRKYVGPVSGPDAAMLGANGKIDLETSRNINEVERVSRFYKRLGIEPGDHVVGVGDLSDALLYLAAIKDGIHYQGFELKSSHVKMTRDLLNRFNLTQYSGSAVAIEGEFSSESAKSKLIPAHSQDFVLMLTGALSDPFPESDPKQVLEEALRVAKNGGKLVLGTVGSPIEREDAERVINEVLVSPAWVGKVQLKEETELRGEAYNILPKVYAVYQVNFTDQAMLGQESAGGAVEEIAGRLAGSFDALAKDTDWLSYLQSPDAQLPDESVYPPLAGPLLTAYERLSKLSQRDQIRKNWGADVLVHFSDRTNAASIQETGLTPGRVNNLGFVGFQWSNPDSVRYGLGIVLSHFLAGSDQFGRASLESLIGVVADPRHPKIESGINALRQNLRYERGWGIFDTQNWESEDVVRPAAMIDFSINETELNNFVDKYLAQNPSLGIKRAKLVAVAALQIWINQIAESMENSLKDGEDQKPGAVDPDQAMLGDKKGLAVSDERLGKTELNANRSTPNAEQVGGIDFNPKKVDLNVQGDGAPIEFHFDPKEFENMKVDGFTPVILNVTPIADLPQFIGLTQTSEQPRLAQAG